MPAPSGLYRQVASRKTMRKPTCRRSPRSINGVSAGPGRCRTKAPGSRPAAYRFHARDLHLVLGPGKDGKPVRYKVTIDGAAPGPDHGVDTMPDGTGTVSSQRLYQLVRQKGSIADHTFAIEFLDAGVQAFVFTFG